MRNIRVTMLGKFDLIVDGQSALSYISNSPKGILLLKYLILSKNRSVSVCDLIDVFWGKNSNITNPESALKTMVSRIRSSLVKANPAFQNCIISENKSYMWNPAISLAVDVFEFEEICAKIQKANTLNDAVRKDYMKALGLYEGDLTYAAIEEDWIVGRSLQLHELYLRMVYKFVRLLKDNGDNELIVHVCRVALDIDAFDENLNLELMYALRESGQNNAALAQYKHVTSAYYKYLGISPSENILGFYKELIQADLSAKTDIRQIRDSLLKSAEIEGGAFVCDYSIFRDIYQLQLRNLERYETKMFLALLTLESTSGEFIEPLVLDIIMRNLLDVLKECLRKGDTIARYSSSQYTILLPMINYASGSVVVDRIKKRFYKKYSENTVRLLCQFGSIDQDQ